MCILMSVYILLTLMNKIFDIMKYEDTEMNAYVIEQLIVVNECRTCVGELFGAVPLSVTTSYSLKYLYLKLSTLLSDCLKHFYKQHIGVHCIHKSLYGTLWLIVS